MQRPILAALAAAALPGAAMADSYYESAYALGDNSATPPYSIFNTNNATAQTSLPSNGAQDITSSAIVLTDALKASSALTGKGMSAAGNGYGLGEALTTADAVASMTKIGAVSHLTFDLDLKIGDTMSLADRAAAIDLADYGWVQPSPFGVAAFSIAATASARLNIADLTTNSATQLYFQTQVVEDIRANNVGQGVFLQLNQGHVISSETCDLGACLSQTFGGSNPLGNTEHYQGGDGEAITELQLSNQDFTMTSNFIAGHIYAVTMGLQCSASVNDKYSTMAGLSASCDAGHSLYWNGITGVPAGFSLLDADGQDFTYSSALSPNPIVSAQSSAPEPAQWALMVAGFGMIGSSLRRRAKPAFC